MKSYLAVGLVLFTASLLRAETPPTPAAPAAPPPGLDACPAAVRDAVVKAAGTDRVKRVRTVRRGEQTLYLADIDRPAGQTLKLQLLTDGSVTKTTETLPLSALPMPVRDALTTLAGTAGVVEEIKKITENSSVLFKAEIERQDEPELDVTVAPDGVILEQKMEED